ncbi:MAG: M28 family peptidase [Gemmataceae bacterium]
MIHRPEQIAGQEGAMMAKRTTREIPTAGGWLGARRSWRWLGAAAVLGVVLAGGYLVQPWTSQAQAPRTNPDRFASDRGEESSREKIPAFDGKRAMGYLEDLCAIGPRISGSEGMKKQQDLIEKHFKDLGAKVTFQNFKGKQNSRRSPVDMANMVVSFHPDRTRRVILCSHYDTRPIADQEPNPRRWSDPFVSANDGGSGVALLMELGHHMKDLSLKVGVDFVFFDGEEYIFEPKQDTYFFGSKHFGKEYAKNRSKTTYLGAVLLDMVAGKGATFPVEQNSWTRASKLVREVWNIAAEQRCAAFTENFSRFAVEDDHIPLNQAGIPAIDIIDFDYPHWHRLTDQPKNCSSAPMEQVARVCAVWIQRVK